MAGRFLAEFELYVMLAVARLGPDAYGARVRQAIEDRTGRPVSIGALYATLARLADKGMLTLRESDPEPGQRGRPRKFARLTAEGEAATRHSAEMLTRMIEGLAFAGDNVRK